MADIHLGKNAMSPKLSYNSVYAYGMSNSRFLGLGNPIFVCLGDAI